MPLAPGTIQYASSLGKLNRLLILAAILLACCSWIDSKPTDTHHLSESQSLDTDDLPLVPADDDFIFFERALPRLGRGSPRLGRAPPRLGRRTAALLLSQLNHPGRYHEVDGDETGDYQYASNPHTEEKRAKPRLGRAIETNEQ